MCFVYRYGLFSCKTNWFSYERFCKKTRFETEAQYNSEMDCQTNVFWTVYTTVSSKVASRNEERLAWQSRKVLWIMVVLHLLDWTSRCFSVVEGNSINTCIHSFSFLVAESPWNSVKQSQTLTTYNTNRNCRVLFYTFVLTFVGQPLSKRLDTEWEKRNLTHIFLY